MTVLVRKDLLYPELSYKLAGVSFEVSNKLGHKYEERLTIGNKEIAKGIIDFLIEDSIVLEIKKGDRFLKGNIDQVNSYLQITGLQLGILANFTSRGFQFKRILNIQNS